MFGEKNENYDLSSQMEKMNIHRNIKIQWANDTINNEYIAKNEKILKRQKTPMKKNFQEHLKTRKTLYVCYKKFFE